MPHPFPTLERALAWYSTDTGFSFAHSDEIVQRMLQEPGVLNAMRVELDRALKSEDAPWPELLTNDRYEVEDLLPPESAKEVVLDLLWDALYPERPARGARPDSFRVYEVRRGEEVSLCLEEVPTGKEEARVCALEREGERLVVHYEPSGARPLPATLRKHLREGVQSFLAGSDRLDGARFIECVDTARGSRVSLPLSLSATERLS